MSLSSGDNLEFTLYKGKAVAEGSEYILIK
jgi:hypothetical protein